LYAVDAEDAQFAGLHIADDRELGTRFYDLACAPIVLASIGKSNLSMYQMVPIGGLPPKLLILRALLPAAE
jgi:hypothetical protein